MHLEIFCIFLLKLTAKGDVAMFSNDVIPYKIKYIEENVQAW